MTQRRRWLVSGLLCGGLSCAAIHSSEVYSRGSADLTTSSQYQAQPCAADLLRQPVSGYRVECGILTAPRSYQNATSAEVQLAVVRWIPAKPSGSPILYLPAAESTDRGARVVAALTANQPLVLFDARGTGRSQPQFCHDSQSKLAALLIGATDDATWQQSRHDVMQQCAETLTANKVERDFFHAEVTVRDAELLRQALQIKQWQLYSVGYGAVIASQYLRLAPHALQQVVMDSPYPPDEFLHTYHQNQQYLIGQLQQQCRKAAACVQQFGDLNQLYQQVLTQLDTQPLLMSVAALDKPFVLTPVKLQFLLNHAALQRDSLSLIPWWLQAIRRQDEAALQSLLQVALAANGQNIAMLLAHECAERARLQQSPLQPDALQAVMAVDAGDCVTLANQQPLQWPTDVSVPVLLFSGGLDVLQADVARFASSLGEHALHIAVPSALQQVVTDQPCAAAIVQQFLQTTATTWQRPQCVALEPVLVIQAQIEPHVAALWQQLRQGHVPLPLWAMLALIGIAVVCGILWPLLRLGGLVLTGQARRVHLGPLRAMAMLQSLCWLASYAGLLNAIYPVVQRQSGELLVGLPHAAVLWQGALVVWILPTAWLMHRAFCWHALRQAFSLLCWLGAAVTALALHLLP